MVMFLVWLPMVFIFLNLFDLLECPVMLTTLILHNKDFTAKLLRQGYRYHKIRKAFPKFYRRHFDIVSKFNVGLETLLLLGLSEPEFYCDLVLKFRSKIGKNDFLIISKR